MGILSCVANYDWSCLTDWSIPNILWWVVQASIIAILVFLREFATAPFIAWKLLRHNRVSKGRGYGTLAADLYIELWKSDKRCDENLIQCIGGAGQISQRPMTT